MPHSAIVLIDVERPAVRQVPASGSGRLLCRPARSRRVVVGGPVPSHQLGRHVPVVGVDQETLRVITKWVIDKRAVDGTQLVRNKRPGAEDSLAG